VPLDFGVSARRGDPAAPFVIEADEYDTAFFDKRSKFVHYRPRTAILNNLEFDHADIFDDLAAIERQFHHLVRTVPASGRLVVNARDEALQRVLSMGCWSGVQRFGGRKEEPGHAARARRAARLRRASRRPEGRPGRVAAARRAQPAERAGGDRRRRACRRRARGRGARRSASSATSGAASSCAARPAASPSTTTSRTTRPPCAPPSTACAARSASARILAAFEPRSNTMKLGAMKAQLPVGARGSRPGVLPQRRARLGRGRGPAAAREARRRRRHDRRAGRAHRRRRPAGRPRALHEQRRLRRRARQAARCAGRGARRRPRASGGVSAPARAPAPGAPPTHLLYLHGFRSSPRSTKAQRMQAWVRRTGPDLEWLCPQLPPSPRAAIDGVFAAIEDWPRERMAVVGSSLGGFYATVVAERTGCRAVLLNPAVEPARDLAGYIGEQTAWHGAERFFFRAEYIDELLALAPPVPLDRPERYFAVIAKGDEVLSWREMSGRYAGSPMRLIEGSDHALSDFETWLPEVTGFLGL
jgi:predicted esterase YcpF (UPF0227 family)